MLLGFDRTSARLSGGWRLRSKGTLKDYHFTVETDARIDGIRLDVTAGKSWLRLLHDVTDAVAAGGAFRFSCHLDAPAPDTAPIEWLAVLREDANGDQRFQARAKVDLASGGRKVWSGTIPPAEPGISYLIACSIVSYPATVGLGAIGCLREGEEDVAAVAATPPAARSAIDTADLAGRIAPFAPDGVAVDWWRRDGIALLHDYFWEAYHARRRGLPADTPLPLLMEQWVEHGLGRGMPPNPLFDERLYRAQVAATTLPPVEEGRSAWLHWLAIGRGAGIIPTALFDDAEYREINGVKPQPTGYEHYLSIGYRRDLSPSQMFSAGWYAQTYAVPPGLPAMVHYATGGEAAGCSPQPDIAALPVADDMASLALEGLAQRLRARAARLHRPEMRAMIAKAALIEPQIMRPTGYRPLTFAPCKHAMARPAHAAARVRRALEGQRFDTIVVVPQCRMAGAARMAGMLARAFVALRPHERTLIVSTERPDFERADWFPREATLLNLPALLGPEKPDDMVRVLLDLVRGTRARRLFNVNSPTAWTLLAQHGRQLAVTTALYAYVFCWDLDAAGTRVGYPVSALPLCLDHMDAVPTDNRVLSDELRDRYGMGDAAAERLFPVLWTPEPATDIDLHARFGARGAPLRCLWAGRFDRQKRMDLMLDLARLRPDLRIDVFGKPVLGDADGERGGDPADLPPNVRLRGAYASLEELRLEEYDLFLYTSAWDGMPSVLIEMAARGLAVVASDVGGVGDLIDDTTGWLVRNWTDPAAYAAAIDAMAADPAAVHARARALRALAHRRHGEAAYADQVAALLARDPRAAAA